MRSIVLLTGLFWAAGSSIGATQTWKTWAETFPEPEFDASARRRVFVTEEVQYIFTVREFTPQVRVQLVERDEASYENPERTAISMLSAAAAGDMAWWQSSWEQPARERSEGTALQPLQSQLKKMAATLTHRIETGPYVIIAYRLLSDDTRLARHESEQAPQLIVTKQVGGVWLATDELEGDPVVIYWNNPGARPRRIER